jgi:hypothetical protein
MTGTPGGFRRPAPALGENNDEIRRELAADDSARAALRTDLAVLTFIQVLNEKFVAGAPVRGRCDRLGLEHSIPPRP